MVSEYTPLYPVPERTNQNGDTYAVSNMGITVGQHATLVFMAAMIGNPHYAPLSYEEMAKQAREAARLYCSYVQ